MHEAIFRGVLGGLGISVALVCGCGDGSGVGASGPRSAEAGSRLQRAGGVRLAAVSEPLVGLDAQDDPAWPTALPKSGDVAEWVKTAPVRVALGRELGSVVGDVKCVGRWTPYRVKLAAVCQYARPDGRTADVTIVQTYGVEDAFGLFSIEAPATGRRVLADHGRAENGAGTRFHAWKGRYYARIRANAEARDAGGALLSRILFVLPDAEKPPLLQAFPQQEGTAPACCLVRSSVSLTGPGAGFAAVPESEKIDGLLGLSRDTLMAVTTYAGNGGANTLWLVRYETPAEARDAFKRYRRYLNGSKDTDAAVTMVAEPKGRYLLGTWTAEEESIANLLPRIRHALPG